MARTVRPAGKSASQAKGKTMHGSPHERTFMALEGRTANNDRKPNGFLGRHAKPASGRNPGRP